MSELRRLMRDLWSTAKSVVIRASGAMWARQWDDVFKELLKATIIASALWWLANILPTIGMPIALMGSLSATFIVRAGPLVGPAFREARAQSYLYTATAKRAVYIETIRGERRRLESLIGMLSLNELNAGYALPAAISATIHGQLQSPITDVIGPVQPFAGEPNAEDIRLGGPRPGFINPEQRALSEAARHSERLHRLDALRRVHSDRQRQLAASDALIQQKRDAIHRITLHLNNIEQGSDQPGDIEDWIEGGLSASASTYLLDRDRFP